MIGRLLRGGILPFSLAAGSSAVYSGLQRWPSTYAEQVMNYMYHHGIVLIYIPELSKTKNIEWQEFRYLKQDINTHTPSLT